MIPAIVSGMYMGEILGFSVSGFLVDIVADLNGFDVGGWSSVFYLFGLLGVVWYPFWVYMAYETPFEHPSISSEELELFKQSKLCFCHHLSF